MNHVYLFPALYRFIRATNEAPFDDNSLSDGCAMISRCNEETCVERKETIKTKGKKRDE